MAASARIAIETEGMLAALGRLAQLGANPLPVLDELGGAMVQRTQERFARGQAPGGAAWKPSLRAIKTSGQTLVASGRMRDDVSHQVNGTEVRWGAVAVYAGIHQFGGVITRQARTQTLAFGAGGKFLSRKAAGKREKGAISVAVAEIWAHSFKMPARPFIGFDQVDQGIAADIIRGALARAAGTGGAGSLPPPAAP